MSRHAHELKPPETPVLPSRRDPIADWLDLFLRMLSLSKAESVAVRDELEDHLRSRVDDLLITGSSEHDAVLQAVGELGETAELARRFKQASHPSRRRQLMSTALIAIAGSALTLGAFSTFNGPTNVAALAGASGHAGNAVAFVAPPGEAAPFDETLRKYDISVFFAPVFQGQWGAMNSAQRIDSIQDTIMSLVSSDSWEDMGGEDASIAVTGNTMFITGSEAIHEGVGWVLDTLIADLNAEREAYAAKQVESEAAALAMAQEREAQRHAQMERERVEREQRNIEREAAYERSLAEAAATRQRQIEELRAQYEQLKTIYIDITRGQALMDLQENDLEIQWHDAEGEEREKMAVQLAEMRAQGAERQLRYDDTRNRLNRVGSLLINLELAEYEGKAPVASYTLGAAAPTSNVSSIPGALERRRYALQAAVEKGTLTQKRADEMMEPGGPSTNQRGSRNPDR